MVEDLLEQKDEKALPSLSLCVVARNEEAALPGLLHSIMEQTYPHSAIQLLLIDSLFPRHFRKGCKGYKGCFYLIKEGLLCAYRLP